MQDFTPTTVEEVSRGVVTKILTANSTYETALPKEMILQLINNETDKRQEMLNIMKTQGTFSG